MGSDQYCTSDNKTFVQPVESTKVKLNKMPAYKKSTQFTEIEVAAFFLGKLNKHHDRDQIYNALRALTKQHNFYIRKLDMPYGNRQTKRGNLGYCFVHCRSKAEADRIVALHYIKLGTQQCEVKAYGGKTATSVISSTASSGYCTPVQDSAETSVIEKVASVLRQYSTSYDE